MDRKGLRIGGPSPSVGVPLLPQCRDDLVPEMLELGILAPQSRNGIEERPLELEVRGARRALFQMRDDLRSLILGKNPIEVVPQPANDVSAVQRRCHVRRPLGMA